MASVPEILAVVAVCIALAAVLVPLVRSRRRTEDLASVAARNGLQHSRVDPFGCARVAFPLFRKGDGQVAENVVWRERPDGLSSRAFDFSYYVETRDDYGRVRRVFTRFSCVMVQVDGAWPEVAIQRSGLLDRALNLVGLGDIQLESDEFNRRFSLRSPDRRFAVTLVDARMIDFLLSIDARVAFAVKGRWVLLTADPVEPPLVPALMRVAEAFLDNVPRVVYELWPSPFRGADGRPLAAGDEGYGHALELARLAEEDPWDIRRRPPVKTVLDDGRPQYDLDGNVVQEKPQNPWGDVPPPREHRGPPGP